MTQVPRDRWGLWAPGAIGLVVGSLILFAITDDPESGGFEPVESAPVKKGGHVCGVFMTAQPQRFLRIPMHRHRNAR